MSRVISELRGGLGNQLFQYAAGRSFSLRRRLPLALDLGPLAGSKRTYALDRLQLPIQIHNSALRSWVAARFPRFEHAIWSAPLQETDFHYDPRHATNISFFRLRGYWQSFRYFHPSLKDELRLPISPADHGLARKIQDTRHSVCIHIRRGDYLRDPITKAFQGLLGNHYYQHAIRHLQERTPDARFFLFSDDSEASFPEITLPDATERIQSHDSHPMYEMALMSLCEHFIIANSSYSWWAAFLGEKVHTSIIAPDQWFADPARTTPDLIPPHWTRLQVQP